MPVVMTKKFPKIDESEVNDFSLPGQKEWCHLIPRLHRALANPQERIELPVFRADFDRHEASAYWETAYYLLVRLIGWPHDHLGQALLWWFRNDRPTLNDRRLTLLKQVWDDQGQLAVLMLWATGQYWFKEDSDRAISGLADELRSLDILHRLPTHSPCVGGSNALHLGHSIVEDTSEDGVTFVASRPEHRRAMLLVERMSQWHSALEKHGRSLPSAAPNHWTVEVVARPLGWVGAFRRSDVTGLWFQGRHSVHGGWRDSR